MWLYQLVNINRIFKYSDPHLIIITLLMISKYEIGSYTKFILPIMENEHKLFVNIKLFSFKFCTKMYYTQILVTLIYKKKHL